MGQKSLGKHVYMYNLPCFPCKRRGHKPEHSGMEHVHFWWISFVLEGHMGIFCSPTWALCWFTLPLMWKVASSLKMNLAGMSMFPALARILRRNLYCTAKSFGFRGWGSWSLLDMVGCGGRNSWLSHVDLCRLHWRKLKCGPQLHQTQRAYQDSCLYKCTLSAWISWSWHKFILGWAVPCEVVCEMHIAQPVRDTFFTNCRTYQLLCCGIAIFKQQQQ